MAQHTLRQIRNWSSMEMKDIALLDPLIKLDTSIGGDPKLIRVRASCPTPTLAAHQPLASSTRKILAADLPANVKRDP
jgi:hypothetical protein